MKKDILADGIELYCGECSEILSSLGNFDALVTDPPYGLGISKRESLGSSNLARVSKFEVSGWDDSPVSKDLLLSVRNKCIHQVVFGGNYFELPPSSCWFVWDKKTTGDYADCELAWTNLKKAVRRIEWCWNGMIRKGDDVRVHPTQKPEGVMIWCIQQLPEGVKSIFDPFMGSGTTGVAAVKLGLRFTGIEMNEKYFDIARKRISEALIAPSFFLKKKQIFLKPSFFDKKR